MSRPKKNRPEGFKLRRYDIYLDPILDNQLIDFLQPYVDRNKAASFIRGLIFDYINQTSNFVERAIVEKQIFIKPASPETDKAKSKVGSSFIN